MYRHSPNASRLEWDRRHAEVPVELREALQSLAKDSPEPRSVEPSEMGNVVELPLVGGLHHQYTRRAA